MVFTTGNNVWGFAVNMAFLFIYHTVSDLVGTLSISLIPICLSKYFKPRSMHESSRWSLLVSCHPTWPASTLVSRRRKNARVIGCRLLQVDLVDASLSVLTIVSMKRSDYGLSWWIVISSSVVSAIGVLQLLLFLLHINAMVRRDLLT